MSPDDKIHIAGHRSLVGAALMRNLATPFPSRGEGRGYRRVGALSEGGCIVAVDPRYVRSTEVETLLGDAGKARNKLGWTPKIRFDDLLKKHGYKAMDYHD